MRDAEVCREKITLRPLPRTRRAEKHNVHDSLSRGGAVRIE